MNNEIDEVIKNSEGPDADGRGWGIQESKLAYNIKKLYKEKLEDTLKEFEYRVIKLDKGSSEGFKGGTATSRMILKNITEKTNEEKS